MTAKRLTQKEVNAEARAIVKALAKNSKLFARGAAIVELEHRARCLRPYLKETGR